MIDLDELDPQVMNGMAALVSEMGPKGVDREDPVRSVMALLGDRRSPLILLVLQTGVWRHAELRRVTAKISAEKALSQRVMTLKLRVLEKEGFVRPEVSDDGPPKVTYSLEHLGMELVVELRRMIGWLNDHRAQICAARRRFGDES